MEFEEALTALKQGKRVAREGWNGKGMWLRITDPYMVRSGNGVVGIKTSLRFIEMNTADGDFVPWVASQSDLLSYDWMIVPTSEEANA